MPISQSGGVGQLPLPEILQAPQGGNLVAPTTQTVTWTSSDFTFPACTALVWYLTVQAISGTSPTVTFAIQQKDSQGAYHGTGPSTSALAGVQMATLANTVSSTTLPVFTPTYRIVATIAGTSPSVTFFVDMYYK